MPCKPLQNFQSFLAFGWFLFWLCKNDNFLVYGQVSFTLSEKAFVFFLCGIHNFCNLCWIKSYSILTLNCLRASKWMLLQQVLPLWKLVDNTHTLWKAVEVKDWNSFCKKIFSDTECMLLLKFCVHSFKMPQPYVGFKVKCTERQFLNIIQRGQHICEYHWNLVLLVLLICPELRKWLCR